MFVCLKRMLGSAISISQNQRILQAVKPNNELKDTKHCKELRGATESGGDSLGFITMNDPCHKQVVM